MPGSLMSRLVNARTQTLDWKKLFEMADAIGDKTHDLSTQPTLGLIRGELKLGGGGDEDDLNSNASRASGYREYVLQRTLGMKAMLTAATNGTCKDPKRRCAIGRALAEPKNPRSLFATFAARATPEGVDAFLRGCEEDLRAIEGELTEENVARTKNFYGAHVNEAHFEYLENQARKCAERAASSSAESSSFTVVPVVVPNMDVVENAAADENANNSGDDEDSGGEASMMFGKKSKKKKNKKNGGGATSATSAAATSNLVSSILAKGKGLTAEDALSIMAEKFGSTEPAFPEIQAWGQTTSSEAAAVVLSILARAPAGCAVVLPSNLMTSTLTFGVRDPSSMNTTTPTSESPSSSSLDTVGFVANTSGALAFSIDAVARPNWRQTNPSVSSAIWISFDDAADDDGDTKDTEDADTITKSALSALKSSKIPVTIAAFTLARAALECDAVAGPSDAVALGAAASARAHARISTALGDDDE